MHITKNDFFKYQLMKESEFKRVKQKIQNIDPHRWWGDDYDVRFYLLHKLKKLKNQKILDIGGGIGIISSELDKTNFRVNLDSSFNDLLTSKNTVDPEVEIICASMTHLPFSNEKFDSVICANILEVAKSLDIKCNKIDENKYSNSFPNIESILSESNRIMTKNGKLFVTTPNNEYFQAGKMSYMELKNSLKKTFSNFSLWFYNSYPRISKKYRKLNFANIFPKFLAKINNDESIFEKMLKPDKGFKEYSVWFYVEATKNSG